MTGIDNTPGSEPTIIAPDRSAYIMVWIGFPLLGAIAGLLVKWLAGWAATLPWVPFQGPLELLDSLPSAPATLGAVALGAIAGLVVAYLADTEMVRVAVSDDDVIVGEGKARHQVARSGVTAVFIEHKHLVLLGRATEELIRVKSDMGKDEVNQLTTAFTNHGWPWRGIGDPYEDDYKRWVPDTPELPSSVNAVFTARAKALSDDDATDAAQLRTELGKLGVVVRDEDKRQFWRRTTGGTSSS